MLESSTEKKAYGNLKDAYTKKEELLSFRTNLPPLHKSNSKPAFGSVDDFSR